MCLETFWRNGRWSLLFPHVPPNFDPSKNLDAHPGWQAIEYGLPAGLGTRTAETSVMTDSIPMPEAAAQLAHVQAAAHPFCFACSASNPMGLPLRYTTAPDGSVSSRFLGNCVLEGYPGVLHGGIVATLLDGAMTNCLFARDIRARTAELRVRYRSPVLAEEELKVRVWLESSHHGLHKMRAEITQNGSLKARANGRFISPNE
jgi:acyl-coenzyme A thioesterase PaaI-like protein